MRTNAFLCVLRISAQLHACSQGRRLTGSKLIDSQKQRRMARAARALHIQARHSRDEGFVFGQKGYMAGIPTAPAGETGQRLHMCLRNRPHEFVAVALRELQATFGRPGTSKRIKSAEQEQRRRSILEDIIYFWMLAETYIQHPALQADMR